MTGMKVTVPHRITGEPLTGLVTGRAYLPGCWYVDVAGVTYITSKLVAA